MDLQYKEITINNYRGIKSCHVQGLSLINLFFGKNNCGKSSLLEALLMLSGPSNPTLPLLVNNYRLLQGAKEDNIKIDFYRTDIKQPILIAGHGEAERKLRISMIESHSKDVSLEELNQVGTEQLAKNYGLKIDFSVGSDEKEYSSKLVIKEGENGKIIRDKNYNESLYTGFIPSGSIPNNIQEKLASIITNKKENEIVDVLRIIEPRIKDLQLVDNEIMVDMGFSTRLPINVLGDGVRKLLSIIVCIHACSNGILLIDEIDNGLHHSVLTKLWKVILMSCQEYHVQLFASTHSIDIIKSLVRVIDENDENLPVASYKLVKKDNDELVALRYGTDQLSYAIEQEMEVR